MTDWGQNVLYRNEGNGGASEQTGAARLLYEGTRWSPSSTFLDYDGDGFLDLFVANYGCTTSI